MKFFVVLMLKPVGTTPKFVNDVRVLGPMSSPNAPALCSRWNAAGFKATVLLPDAPITPEGAAFDSGL